MPILVNVLLIGIIYLYLMFGGGDWLNSWLIVQLFNFRRNAWTWDLLTVSIFTSLFTDSLCSIPCFDSLAGTDLLAYSTDRYCPLTFNWCRRSSASAANCWDGNLAKVTVYLSDGRIVLVLIAPYFCNNTSRRSSESCGGKWRILRVSHA